MARNNNNSGQGGGNAGVVTDPSQNLTSHYFVHPSDGPNTVTVTPVLNGSNYHVWARSMRRALGSKNKFRFVDGSIDPPSIMDPTYTAWERCNLLIHLWIMNSVSETIAPSIVFIENAIDVWRDLKDRFSQGDLICISELQLEIHALKQGSKPVTEFFTELKSLWEELEAYRPVPSCACPVRCQCASMRNARVYHQQDYVIRFLTGLNDHFSVVKSQILLMDPLPSINRVFSMVIQHERQNIQIVSDDSFVNAVDRRFGQGRGRGGYNQNFDGRNSSKICSFCGKTGHTVDVCYRKHGYPPNYFQKNSSVASSSANESYEQKDESSVADKEPKANLPTFTTEQYEKLLALIQGNGQSQHAMLTTQGSSSTQHRHTPAEDFKSGIAFTFSCHNSGINGSWIIDSGASDHICSSLYWFQHYRN